MLVYRKNPIIESMQWPLPNANKGERLLLFFGERKLGMIVPRDEKRATYETLVYESREGKRHLAIIRPASYESIRDSRSALLCPPPAKPATAAALKVPWADRPRSMLRRSSVYKDVIDAVPHWCRKPE